MITHSTTYHPFYSSFAARLCRLVHQERGVNGQAFAMHLNSGFTPISIADQKSVLPLNLPSSPDMEALKSALQKSLQTLNAPSIASADGHLPGKAKE